MIEFLLSHWTFPEFDVWLSFFPYGLIIGISAGIISGRVRVVYNWPVGYTRKTFHFIIFTFAGITGLLGGFEAVQVFGTAVGLVVAYAVWKNEKSHLYQAIARPSDAPYKTMYIIIPFCMTALGGMISNIFFGPCAMIGYIATGWGDAVGEPVGTRWGKHKYRVPTLTGLVVHRSIEGSLAVFCASFFGCLFIIFTGFDVSVSYLLFASVSVALVTMLVEAVTFHSLDNLTIQVTASWIAMLLLT